LLLVGGSTPWKSARETLIKAREPGRALGVADLRLHRSDHARSRSRTPAAEQPGQGAQLGLVADHGAGAVRFDQPEVGRRPPGLGVGALEGALLTLEPWRGQPEMAAVARSGDGFDDG